MNPLESQKAYYDARAPEYNDWWERKGRYDRGAEATAAWRADIDALDSWLDEFQPSGSVLELACGTGNWTEKLLKHSGDLTAVDASPEMLAQCRARVGADKVRFLQSDIFDYEPDRQFDVVFFGFWLSHVPTDRFEEFWNRVRAALKPDGRFFFVDSQYEASSTAADHILTARTDTRQTRKLNDGSEYQIYKIFYEPTQLREQLDQSGFESNIRATPRFFLCGEGCLKK
jgi:ubiquinone/menaquinone biosynthesis C-methylase UbiE